MSRDMIYLDHHATTPLDPRVLKVMLPYLDKSTMLYGNEASGHVMTAAVEKAVVCARCQVADLIGADPNEIIFTSGATESNNLVLRGFADAGGRLIITSNIEHASVIEASDSVQPFTFHYPITALEIKKDHDLVGICCDDGLLVSCMAANNETGQIVDIDRLSSCANKSGSLFHTDATQRVVYGTIDVGKLSGISFLSLSSHKLYGPKGVGALFIRKGFDKALKPQLLGGGQELGIRSGTLNVPGIVGFGEACRLMRDEGPEEGSRIRAQRDRLWDILQEGIFGIERNGMPLDQTLPHSLNVYLPKAEAETLRMMIPHIAISTGSACSAKSNKQSHVLKALYPEQPRRLQESVRISLGRFTTDQEIVQAGQDIVDAVAQARQSG